MRVYVALRDRLLRCSTDGTSWETATQLEGRALECVATTPATPDRVFVGAFESGLFRSTDGGETFERLETDDVFESDAVMSLTISPHDPDVIYAGTEPSRVYRSTDGGDSWTRRDGLTDLPSASEWYFPPRPETHHVRWLEVDPFDPDRLYVGIEAGAFVLSEDGGETWRERPEGSRIDNHSLATHPDREGRVYTAAGDGYAESDDGGEHWDQPQDGLDHRYCWSVVPDPADPERVLVSSASGASTAHTASRAESYVYRRRKDEGDPWERLDGTGLPMGDGVVRAIFAAAEESGEIYGVNNQGLYVTENFGDSWDRVDIEWPEGAETQTPRGLAVVEP
ncbi:WD40/YVTN domain protein [Natrialba magadii ATCC 43099]|uniref:WD40/YVTN domain protein n=1 Tax=Natrialba magadii (strain ATCC 43099 / DSM 3394 / CCM 3739 / CIP 104546 / IAM 13178 / JCM 8861 / NBRC 102185 / NCIMB 2190 / MS3) TaxID=547559 RepID=D3SSC2_NATMM|nr:hypothetical protein [Natrialba magadii]ADD04848.1 WD40/YVTN domain protein [Natrialba magadii ATCC 43099]ELY24433.1 hypothetical protein C500_18860 [Natrialba magadii ATCC 43099]